MNEDLTPEVFLADYVGEPGKRMFFIQAVAGPEMRTFQIEKQQVLLLTEKLSEMLLVVDPEDTIKSTMPGRDPVLTPVEPIEPLWRVGTIAIAYEEDPDRVVILLQPGLTGEEDEAEEPDGTRFYLRRDQVRAFILHANAAADEGRPLCQLCGLPMDPDGHACPASNGHRPTKTI
jgi:uncharacterized repeat protein (TIGR03847 family)